MDVFYSADIRDNSILLSPDESSHCIRVMRLRKGEKALVIDGRGGIFEAEIEDPNPSACHLKVIRSIPYTGKRNFKIHIAIAPTKNIDRFEWFIEKAVEIGVDTITPILCQRSERRILKTDRLHKLVIATIKQAIIPVKPIIKELTPFPDFISSLPTHLNNRFIAHCQDPELQHLKHYLSPGTDILILIGPEGDFSSDEIEKAVKSGFTSVSLGKNRLRTETAGIVACHTAHLLTL